MTAVHWIIDKEGDYQEKVEEWASDMKSLLFKAPVVDFQGPISFWPSRGRKNAYRDDTKFGFVTTRHADTAGFGMVELLPKQATGFMVKLAEHSLPVPFYVASYPAYYSQPIHDRHNIPTVEKQYVSDRFGCGGRADITFLECERAGGPANWARAVLNIRAMLMLTSNYFSTYMAMNKVPHKGQIFSRGRLTPHQVCNSYHMLTGVDVSCIQDVKPRFTHCAELDELLAVDWNATAATTRSKPVRRKRNLRIRK